MRNNFYNKFKQFIRDNVLFEQNDKILLAVSGGIDSVVMVHLFHRLGQRFAMAHCNFQLRGEDSDGDEQFVKTLAHNLGAPYYTMHFDTEIYAVERGISIQMAARELRYAWFGELLKTNDCKYLATAHHKDDVAETILLNLVKGSILKGLHGILPKSEQVVRPLLWASKKEILEYGAYKKIAHREDKSNAENKYQRNLIRNQIMPLLEKINPDVSDTIYHAAARRKDWENWGLAHSLKTKDEIVLASASGMKVIITDLEARKVPPEIFFTWVEEYGFNYLQVNELFAAIHSPESKIFIGKGYRMVKDRQTITIDVIAEHDMENLIVEMGQHHTESGNLRFSFETMHKNDIEDYDDPNTAYLDSDKVHFPLMIRKWEHGDRFKPFGMRGQKKISDFLTDLKMPFQQKESQLVILSGDTICWVVGKRIDDRFKVDARTKKVFKIVVSDDMT